MTETKKKEKVVLVSSNTLRQIKASVGFNLFISIDLNYTDDLIDIDIEEIEEEGKKIIVCTSDYVQFKFDSNLKLKKDFVYISEEGYLEKLILYDEYDRPYVLKPTNSLPDVMQNSSLMYESNPKQMVDSELKIIKRSAGTKLGNVLLTDFQLGYLCKELAKISNSIITYQEINELIEMSQINPYTKSLFTYDNVKLMENDLMDEILELKENSLGLIINNNRIGNDDRYFSMSFFNQCYRIMKPGAKMIIFHPGSNSLKKLNDIGFKVLNKGDQIVCQK